MEQEKRVLLAKQSHQQGRSRQGGSPAKPAVTSDNNALTQVRAATPTELQQAEVWP